MRTTIDEGRPRKGWGIRLAVLLAAAVAVISLILLLWSGCLRHVVGPESGLSGLESNVDLLATSSTDDYHTTPPYDTDMQAFEQNGQQMYRVRIHFQFPDGVINDGCNWEGYNARLTQWKHDQEIARRRGKPIPARPSVPKGPYQVFMCDLSTGQNILGTKIPQPSVPDSVQSGAYEFEVPACGHQRVNYKAIAQDDQGYLWIAEVGPYYLPGNNNGHLFNFAEDGNGGVGDIMLVDDGDTAKREYLVQRGTGNIAPVSTPGITPAKSTR